MDKSKLLKNLIEALQMMPDGLDEEAPADKEVSAMPGMPSDPGDGKEKGIEIVKVKALGKGEKPEMEMGEDDDEMELESAEDILKKKKMAEGMVC